MTAVPAVPGTTLVVPAPAKLNLFLHVVGRRPDGYHLLESLMVLLDHHDTLRLTVNLSGRVRRLSGNEGIAEDHDLIVRAARLMQEKAGGDHGVDLVIEKRIPVGGGLGGGSSDAAAVLLALNRLWNIHLDRADLCTLGLRLGADVPFFVFGESAFVTGIGEALLPVSVARAWFLVLIPPESVPTAHVFQSPELTRNTPCATIIGFPEFAGRNDLQAVTLSRYPEVGRCLRILEGLPGASGARMTGSGACVFAWFPDERAARTAHSALPVDCRGFVAQLVPRHPLAGFADSLR